MLVDEDCDHGASVATWFGRGYWPTCTCGYAPRDNAQLNAHWAEHGLRVYHDSRTGELVHEVIRGEVRRG